jgi:hypothetical protein
METLKIKEYSWVVNSVWKYWKNKFELLNTLCKRHVEMLNNLSNKKENKG